MQMNRGVFLTANFVLALGLTGGATQKQDFAEGVVSAWKTASLAKFI